MPKIKRKFDYKKLASIYFRQGMPDISNMRDKRLKRILKQEIKRRRLLQVNYKYKYKNVKKFLPS